MQAGLGATPELGRLSQAGRAMAELLTRAGLWYLPEHEVLGGQYRLDFWVLGPLGGSYDVEVDGRGHWTDEQIRADRIRDAAVEAQNFKVIRIEARHVFHSPDRVLAVLRRLV